MHVSWTWSFQKLPLHFHFPVPPTAARLTGITSLRVFKLPAPPPTHEMFYACHLPLKTIKQKKLHPTFVYPAPLAAVILPINLVVSLGLVDWADKMSWDLEPGRSLFHDITPPSRRGERRGGIKPAADILWCKWGQSTEIFVLFWGSLQVMMTQIFTKTLLWKHKNTNHNILLKRASETSTGSRRKPGSIGQDPWWVNDSVNQPTVELMFPLAD